MWPPYPPIARNMDIEFPYQAGQALLNFTRFRHRDATLASTPITEALQKKGAIEKAMANFVMHGVIVKYAHA